MEKVESKNINSTISELKKKLGLDKCTVIHKPIPIKKDGKHLYQVVGYNHPLRPETIERLNIPPQKVLFEVVRDEWHKEMDAARENHRETLDPELYPFGYED